MEFDGLDEANLTGDGVFVDSSETKIMIDFINYVAYGIVANVIVGVGIVGNILVGLNQRKVYSQRTSLLRFFFATFRT